MGIGSSNGTTRARDWVWGSAVSEDGGGGGGGGGGVETGGGGSGDRSRVVVGCDEDGDARVIDPLAPGTPGERVRVRGRMKSRACYNHSYACNGRSA